MKIALIGASGLVGSAVLEEAISRGHEVTAIVREPQKIKLQSEKLRAEKADITNTEEAVPFLQNHDVVVSAFSVSAASENIYKDSMKGYHAVQKAVKEAGAKRFFVVVGAGSLYIQPGVQLVDTPQFPAEYKAGATAARDYFIELEKETELNWTALSPALNFIPAFHISAPANTELEPTILCLMPLAEVPFRQKTLLLLSLMNLNIRSLSNNALP